MKCTAFWEEHNIGSDAAALKDKNKLCGAMVKREVDECKAQYKSCSKTILKLQQKYKFIQSKKNSEVCQFWYVLLDMIKNWKMLIASER